MHHCTVSMSILVETTIMHQKTLRDLLEPALKIVNWNPLQGTKPRYLKDWFIELPNTNLVVAKFHINFSFGWNNCSEQSVLLLKTQKRHLLREITTYWYPLNLHWGKLPQMEWNRWTQVPQFWREKWQHPERNRWHRHHIEKLPHQLYKEMSCSFAELSEKQLSQGSFELLGPFLILGFSLSPPKIATSQEGALLFISFHFSFMGTVTIFPTAITCHCVNHLSPKFQKVATELLEQLRFEIRFCDWIFLSLVGFPLLSETKQMDR